MSKSAHQRSIRFDNQVVIITGAGRGLGRAYAELIAARGGQVVVHDAGVAKDGSGFDPSVADGVVAEITAKGGAASACYENLEDAAGCRRIFVGPQQGDRSRSYTSVPGGDCRPLATNCRANSVSMSAASINITGGSMLRES
jgi:NAD(P)-dependent dehydrogenase (short-subunit alcohol dehydrogenase family)